MELEKIAKATEGQLVGSGCFEITGISLPDSAGSSDIVFIEKNHFIESAIASDAAAFLVDRKLSFDDARPRIVTDNPRFSFIKLLQLFEKPIRYPENSSPSRTVGKNCIIDPNAVILPGCFIGDDVVIEAGVVIHPQCVIEDHASIGRDSTVHSRVVIGRDCVIGSQCVIHPGAVIGSIGFGYHDEGGTRLRIPHLGNVVLSDRVDVGANSTIDRSVLGSTFVGPDTKVDNLVQVGHNVSIGANCYVVAQVGIGGSASIGQGVVLGGQSGVSDHIKIGDQAMIAGKSAVRESLEPGAIVGEPPAFPIRIVNDLIQLLPKLPALFHRVSVLEKRQNQDETSEFGGSWRQRVTPILARTLRVQEDLIGDDMDLKEEFNADSLTVLTVVTEIESEFEISIPDSDVREMRTLGGIIDYLESKHSSAANKE